MSRHGEPDRAIAEMRAWDELEPHDWPVGGPEGRDIRAKGGRNSPALPMMYGWPVPCRLCEPGYVCAFHRPEPDAATG